MSFRTEGYNRLLQPSVRKLIYLHLTSIQQQLENQTAHVVTTAIVVSS